MTLRRLMLVVLVVIFLILLRPRQVWSEVKRIRSQWNTILRLLVFVVLIYIVYGVYLILAGDLAWWPF